MVKADQFREVSPVPPKPDRLCAAAEDHPLRHPRLAVRPRTGPSPRAASQKARDIAQRTFDIAKQEQHIGAKSSADTLASENALAVAESALYPAQTAYEKAKVDIDRATATPSTACMSPLTTPGPASSRTGHSWRVDFRSLLLKLVAISRVTLPAARRPWRPATAIAEAG